MQRVEHAYVQLDGSGWRGSHWSTPGRRASLIVTCDSLGRSVAREDDNVITRWNDPLPALDWMASHFPRPGRWVGYLSYDLGRHFEVLPTTALDDLRTDLFAFAFVPDETPSEVLAAHDRGPKTAGSSSRVTSTFNRSNYLASVQRCIDYIGAGDVFQVNLSQRFTAPLLENPVAIYQRLLQRTPAIYGGFLAFDHVSLLCNSPELFLRVTPSDSSGTRRVMTRPIKGTRPARLGMRQELQDSLKDQAELNMIVDLERNDLGRVCEIGSVKVTQPRVIEEHPTVLHGVATIEGDLRRDVSFVDLLRATFPGGSVTGAPKIRAMEIIEELEPVRRGPYCGAIGYLASDGSMEFNIAIRTMIVQNNLVHLSVGGGIVADSQPAAEYEETLVKAQAMFAALGISGDDLAEVL